MVQLLYGNAATLQTLLGGGIHIHITLIMSPAEYITLSVTAYTQTAYLHPNAVISGTETAMEIQQRRYEHRHNWKEYKNYQIMELALKYRVIEYVEPFYLAEKRNRFTQYLWATTRELVDNLLTR